MICILLATLTLARAQNLRGIAEAYPEKWNGYLYRFAFPPASNATG